MYGYIYIIYFQGRPRHSQSQGLIERGNQTIEDKLAAIKEDEDLQVGDTFHWAKHLPRIMYIMNTQLSETTKTSPYSIVFGQEPNRALVPGMQLQILEEDELTMIAGTVDITPSDTPPVVDTVETSPSPVDDDIADTPVDIAPSDMPPSSPQPAPRRQPPRPEPITPPQPAKRRRCMPNVSTL